MKSKIFCRNYVIVFLALPLFFQNSISVAQPVIRDTSNPSFGLFENEAPLEISLQFDLPTYLRTKPKEEYMKGKITFHPGSADSMTRDIRLRTRGIFRHEQCYYAPMELNFKNADFGYTDLDSIGKIKLVTQCKPDSESEKNVLIEYLTYKMFSAMTDTSFRVRLLRVNYIDFRKQEKSPSQSSGFLSSRCR